jgi:hypothetical protein
MFANGWRSVQCARMAKKEVYTAAPFVLASRGVVLSGQGSSGGSNASFGLRLRWRYTGSEVASDMGTTLSLYRKLTDLPESDCSKSLTEQCWVVKSCSS